MMDSVDDEYVEDIEELKHIGNIRDSRNMVLDIRNCLSMAQETGNMVHITFLGNISDTSVAVGNFWL